jgi:hypothetical protein
MEGRQKIMDGRQPNRFGESLTAREKRVVSVVAVVLLLVFGGVGVWAATDPGSYGRSRDGCVNVTTAGSTGGGILHECGTKAKTLCHNAFTQNDKLAWLARPQCRLAGLGP